MLLRSFLSTVAMFRSVFPSEKTIEGGHLEVNPLVQIVYSSFLNKNGSNLRVESDDFDVVSGNSCVISKIVGCIPELIPQEQFTNFENYILIESNDLPTVPLAHPFTLDE